MNILLICANELHIVTAVRYDSESLALTLNLGYPSVMETNFIWLARFTDLYFVYMCSYFGNKPQTLRKHY